MKSIFNKLTVAVMAALMMTVAAKAADDGSVDPFKYWSSQWESSKAVDREVPAKKAKVDDAPKAVAPTKPVEQPSGDKPVAAKPVTKPVERVAPVPVRMVRETRIINRGMDKETRSQHRTMWSWFQKNVASGGGSAPNPKPAKADKASVEKATPAKPVVVDLTPEAQAKVVELTARTYFGSQENINDFMVVKDGSAEKPRDGVSLDPKTRKWVVTDWGKLLRAKVQADGSGIAEKKVADALRVAAHGVWNRDHSGVVVPTAIGELSYNEASDALATRLADLQLGVKEAKKQPVTACLVTILLTLATVFLIKKFTIWLG